jgi:hypothetical protein
MTTYVSIVVVNPKVGCFEGNPKPVAPIVFVQAERA